MPPNKKQQSAKAKADEERAARAASFLPAPLAELTHEERWQLISDDKHIFIDDEAPPATPSFWQARKGAHKTFCCQLCLKDWIAAGSGQDGTPDLARESLTPELYPKSFRQSIVNLTSSDIMSTIMKHFRDKHRNENLEDSPFARYFPEKYNHYMKGGAPDIKILMENSCITKQVCCISPSCALAPQCLHFLNHQLTCRRLLAHSRYSQVLEGFALTQENWAKLGLLIANKMVDAKDGLYNNKYNSKGDQLTKFMEALQETCGSDFDVEKTKEHMKSGLVPGGHRKGKSFIKAEGESSDQSSAPSAALEFQGEPPFPALNR